MQVQDRKELTIVSDDDRKSCGIDLLNDHSIAIGQPKRHRSSNYLLFFRYFYLHMSLFSCVIFRTVYSYVFASLFLFDKDE